ncbi:MAG: ABC transporter ATP-binding protein [candidate division KSB1 bacterium]|nr:ABC transporter ATP-binding protein [candidate division KSB1 bacterium]
MIKIVDLSKSFGSFYALRQVNLEIHNGEFWMIVGPNGAGKTTLLKIIATLAQPTNGVVEINDDIPPGPPSKGGSERTEAKGESERIEATGGAERIEAKGGSGRLQVRRQIGFIGHQSFLYSNLTAEENLKFYARMYQLPNGEQRIQDILQQVGLIGRKNDLVRTFSRGMQQRLSIGRALLSDPKIILLDEPFSGLDQNAIENFVALFTSLISPDRIIIMTTHDLQLGLQLASHFAVISRGRIVHQGKNARSFDLSQFKALYKRLTDEST